MDVHALGAEVDRAPLHHSAFALVRSVRERLGDWIGRAWTPAIAAITRARHSRMFHPEGLVFRARVDAVIGGRFAALGGDLEGHALVRCSAALWKREHTPHWLRRFDVLGMALRLRHGAKAPTTERAEPGDQDLLFATIRSPLTMFASPFTTNATDYLHQRYWAVSPFQIPDGERVELRLVPIEQPTLIGARETRLVQAVQLGAAVWELEARETLHLGWHRVARITLEAPLEIDQEALRFDPFRTGAGIEPVGLVHAIRRAVYAAGQLSRPPRESA